MPIKSSSSHFFLRALQAALLFLCLLVSYKSFSIETIQLFVEEISIEQLLSDSVSDKSDTPSESIQKNQLVKYLQLDKLSIKLDLLSMPVKFQIDASKLDLPEPFKSITTLDITCADFLATDKALSCNKGQLSFSGLVAQKLTSANFNFDYNRVTNDLSLSIEQLNIGAGNLSFKYQLTGAKWQVLFTAEKLDYKYFTQYIKYYSYQNNEQNVFNKLENAGAVMSFSGEASGLLAENTKNTGRLNRLKIKGKLRDGQYQYGDDLAEKLALDFSFELINSSNKKSSSGSGNYRVSFSVDALEGEIIQNDLYVVLNGKERLTMQFNYQDNQSINFTRLDFSSAGSFDLVSKGKILLDDPPSIHQLDTHIEINNLSQFNQAYLNNILSGGDYEELQVEGGISVTINKNQEIIKLNTKFRDFSLAFNEELSLVDLNGRINWNNIRNNLKQKDTEVPMSQLSWQELTLNHLPFGASTLNFIFHNDSLRLSQEVDIPLFDGALHINSLQVSDIFPQLNSQPEPKMAEQSKSLSLVIDGMIKPISLSLFSEHFDWPLLDGTLSAVIPATSYNEKYLSVGGALMLQVFDGVIIVKDLRIVEPLKDYAQLFANIDLNNLNLKSLTKTYNFGEIDGRLEGKFSGLELNAWEPVVFDAYIRTPDNDKSSHRISQRAIDNLSSLGGASGLLSRSFLSFFETFRYDKIGLSCKLKNNICQMSGVEAKGDSYYIVKGGGIPRIDVMGFQRQVNWQVLTSRLKAIQLANEAVIE